MNDCWSASWLVAPRSTLRHDRDGTLAGPSLDESSNSAAGSPHTGGHSVSDCRHAHCFGFHPGVPSPGIFGCDNRVRRGAKLLVAALALVTALAWVAGAAFGVILLTGHAPRSSRCVQHAGWRAAGWIAYGT
jgi:hypothetical protein